MYTKNSKLRRDRKIQVLISIFGCLLLLQLFTHRAKAQGAADTPQAKNTEVKADQNLRSSAKINPSTLAMEMSIPLFSYPGRNGNSLPVGISYSSKLWRMKNRMTYFYDTPIGEYRQYVTQIWPMFAERSAAGWTSSVPFPTIEEKVNEWYEEEGKPFPNLLDINALDYIVENFVCPSSNLNEAIPECCNRATRWCMQGTEVCTSWNCTDWDLGCVFRSGGGGGGGEPQCPNWNPYCSNIPTPSPASPPKMHYVKRVNVRMGDGSVHEFRKSDAVFGHCNGTENDGPNCEPIDPDIYGNFLAVEGSGLKLNHTTDGSTLFLPDGSRYEFPNDATGYIDGTRLYRATNFIDSSGNHSVVAATDETRPLTEGDQRLRKMTDTMGREVVDPLPVNLSGEEQHEGVQDINLPGMGGQGQQNYKLRWLHLKPVPCTPESPTNCGAEEGALENQSENLFFYTAKTCIGSWEAPVDPNNEYPNEIMFPMNGLGIRSCNKHTGSTPAAGQAVRFNPVVLAGIELPNGMEYGFKYNQFGEITKIIYPTGSYETFTYARILPMGGNNEAAYSQTNRGVVERRMYSSGSVLEQRWVYSVSTSAGYKITTTHSKGNDPLAPGIKSERYLVNDIRDETYFGFTDPRAGMPYEEKTYDENNVLRSRTLTEWITKGPIPTNDSLRPANPEASRDARPKRNISIAIENGQALATMSETEYDETGSTDPEHFSHLNVKRSKSHHFRNIPLSVAQTGTLVQIAGYFNSSTVAAVSETDYLYDANYKARGISSLPIESRTLSPADNSVLAKTQTKYDNQVPGISTGYPGGYTTETYGISGYYDCGMVAPNKCWVDPNTQYLGRPTTSRLWDSDNSTWIETHTRYDIFGNAVAARNPIGNEATTLFEDTTAKPYKYAYPTRVDTSAPDPTNTHGTNEISFSTSTYDFMTGLPLTATNELGQTTATEYNDSLLRPTRAFAVNFSAPETQTIYDDDNLTVTVKKQIDTVNWDEATTFRDLLGRTVKTRAKDSQGDVFVETKYDFLGRVQMLTNPYRQGDTVLWSLTEYDEMGRAKQSREPVANQNPASPTGNILGVTGYDISTAPGFLGLAVTSTDASGKKGRSITNALGQLVVVEEPDHQGNLAPLPQSTPQPSPTPTPGGGGGGGHCLIPENCPENLASGEYPSYATFYKYDANGKMVEVVQGVQHRYFKYDALGRLLRVNQPEQEYNPGLDLPDGFNGLGRWTAGFAYDLLGNVVRATDANGVNIISEYDRAGRVTRRCYTEPNINTTATNCAQIGGDISLDTPTVDFFYDGKGLAAEQTPNFAKGNVTKVTSSVSETRYKLFDNFGRITETEQRTPVGDETISTTTPRVSKYTYNFSGALIEEEYPSGRKVRNEFEPDGDLAKVTSAKTANSVHVPYVSNFSYTASGGISQMRLGNGRWETAKFNQRLQVKELGLGASATDTGLWKVGYEYGELDANGDIDTGRNTGNIARQTLTVPGANFVQSYKYDSLYRIKEAKETTNSNTNWIQNWDYDRYGNRTSFAQNIAGVTTAPNPSVDTNSNRFDPNQGFSYDKNGNVVRDVDPVTNHVRDFVFNGDNKQSQVKDVTNGNLVVGTYFYDGEGKRVKKVTDTETTVFVYSSGKLVAEYSTQISQTPTVAYTTTDHLGSPRVITDATGQVTSRRDFMPFGEDLFVNVGARSTDLKYGTSSDNVRQKFTGYQKDTETSLDFAEARMYENRFGRFTAVDPLLASGKSADPQTFNRFIYVGNNPIITTDPSGLSWYQRSVNGRSQYQWSDDDQVFGDGSSIKGWTTVNFGAFTNTFRRLDDDFCVGSVCGKGAGYIYKYGGWDYGERANYGLGDVLADTGVGVGKWGFNGMATVSEGVYGILGRLTWEYAFTGRPREMPSVHYFEYSNQSQANAGTAMTIVSFLAPAFKKPGTIAFAEIETNGASNSNFGLSESIARRPSNFRKGVDASVWESAANGPNGGRMCSTCGKEVFWNPGEARFNSWHIDHYDPKWYQRTFEGMTRKQVLDDYNNIEKLRFRCAPCNLADNH